MAMKFQCCRLSLFSLQYGWTLVQCSGSSLRRLYLFTVDLMALRRLDRVANFVMSTNTVWIPVSLVTDVKKLSLCLILTKDNSSLMIFGVLMHNETVKYGVTSVFYVLSVCLSVVLSVSQQLYVKKLLSGSSWKFYHRCICGQGSTD